MKTKILTSLMASLLMSAPLAADLINEFQPNPFGTDPANQMIELIGTPGAAYSGFLITVDSDGAGGTAFIGTVDRENAIQGNYDANGFAVITIPDLENPSFTLVFSTASPGLGTDLDLDGDGLLDAIAGFGTVFDAINIPDSVFDQDAMYGSQLGGVDMTYSGDEPKLTFRDGVTGDWYSVNDQGNTPENVFDEFGNQVPNGAFNLDPELPTFGSMNPSIPEPVSSGLLGLALVGFGFVRRR